MRSPPSVQPIEISFLADWASLMTLYMTHIGASTRTRLSDVWALTAAVLNAEHLHVPIRPRSVVVGKGLPDSTELQTFLTAVEAGADLNAAQSNLYAADFNDRILNDLGVRHFCIDAMRQPRSNQRLFAIVTRDTFFAIEVSGHDTFASEALTQRVHEQWPQLLARFIQPDVVPGSSDVRCLEERAVLRELGFNTVLQMADGTIYVPPGGGMAFGGLRKTRDPEKSRGLSWVVVGQANAAYTYIRRMERIALENIEKLQLLIDAGQRVVLGYRDNTLYAINLAKGIAAKLGTSPFRLRLDEDHWLLPTDAVSATS